MDENELNEYVQESLIEGISVGHMKLRSLTLSNANDAKPENPLKYCVDILNEYSVEQA